MEDFEAWVQARGAGLARSAYLLTGDVHLAEDLVQDTLARLADKWRRVTREGSPDAYARQVMHHLAVDRWRRRRARPPVAGDPHQGVAGTLFGTTTAWPTWWWRELGLGGLALLGGVLLLRRRRRTGSDSAARGGAV